MVVYNFKKIQPVPTATDFVDIVLTRTQRKTPTVIHPQFSISRIRAFYMRKVKFTQQTYSEKLSQIINDFPRLDDIHPFYADLINILYDRDHYKLALGQINTARALIDQLAKDYLKMLKFGDSLYRCKQLKRAALGRMCTIMRNQKQSLAYLEEVRKHLARLPSIDPNTRTLLVTGFPNVGKSSFMNKVTRANVEVQPYAFTTKSLYVGHMDYKYLRWQVIDTPGILDHPLEERNTIEMQAVTALAHLQASVLFFIDISEQCGYPVEQQVSLFNNIRPLFANKPLIIVINKIDQLAYNNLLPEKRELIEKAVSDSNAKMLQMSNHSEEGLNNVRTVACDDLLEHRVDSKVKGKKVTDVVNRLTVALPAPRDNKVREVCITDSVRRSKEDGATVEPRRTEKDLMWENGGPGVYSADFTKQYMLKNSEHRTDFVPEIIDGKNIADFVDPDILKRLEELEREEEANTDEEMDEESEVDEEQRKLVKQIREKKQILVNRHRMEKNKNRSTIPRNKKKSAPGEEARGRKRGRSVTRDGGDSMEVEGEETAKVHKTDRSRSRTRGHSQPPSTAAKQTAFSSDRQKALAVKVQRKQQRELNIMARAGESDRKAGPKLAKHRLAGKRKQGSTYSR